MATPSLDTKTKNVLLVIGKSKSPILANAAVLSHGCAYYKNALNDTWHQEATIPRGVQLNPQAAKSIKAVLTHPNADYATVKIVLGFIEVGKITVPDDSLAQVAYFADELALPSLVQQCLAHYAKHYVKTENTLLFTMLCLDLNHPELLEEAYKKVGDINWLAEVIQAGRLTLADADAADVERLFSLKGIRTVEQKWRIVIGWLKSRQGLYDISVEGGAKGFDLEQAHEEATPLMHHIDWKNIQTGAYSVLRAQVLPYLAVTSPEYQAWFNELHGSFVLSAVLNFGVLPMMENFQRTVSIQGSQVNMIERNRNGTVTTFRADGFNLVKSGAIDYLGDLTDLEELTFESPRWDRIPESFMSLPNLNRLYVRNSLKTALFPKNIGNLSNLTELIISHKSLHGPIPESVGSLSNLKLLNLEKNSLDGAIPPSITRLNKLETLNLGCNKLSGTIPKSIGDLVNLKHLSLENNELSGVIPSSIVKIPGLAELRLFGNQLYGEVPEKLLKSASLYSLDVQNNCLSGAPSPPSSVMNFHFGTQKPAPSLLKRMFK
ncbi:hypothetical protein BDR26DRAFT_1006144 [Obelidium mucronatum]|nr:hypothetical protein BDR26DRAFT_1006144 [Obelidium mucronatum]